MRLLLLPILIFSLMSCGIKKELAEANQSNKMLRERVKELELNNTKQKENLKNCSKTNAILYEENKEFARRINLLQGENSSSENENEEVYTVVEVMPEFPGGFAAMHKWIGDNIDLPHYVESLNGTVYVRFVVGKDGQISKVTLTKGIHHDYDKASLAVVQKMPKWTPGEQAGKKVNVRYNIPIRFRLQ